MVKWLNWSVATLAVKGGTILQGKRAGTQGIERLPNGAILTWDAGGAPGSDALGIFLHVGGRDERTPEWGAAHFLEHLVFKGAGQSGPRQIADVMDRLGGDVNAFTTRDLTCYHAHVLDEDVRGGFELLWAMVTAPWLKAEDVDRERGVIREELREALDDAEDRAEQAFMEALWGPHAVARDVLGSEESLQSLTAEVLQGFWRDQYRPGRMVVALAGPGAVAALDFIRDHVAAWSPPGSARPKLGAPVARGGSKLVGVPGDQAQVVIGVPAVPWGHEQAMATRLLAIAFGGQNSSRLWQRIREQSGIAYHVGAQYSAQWDYADMTVAAGVAPEHLNRVVQEMAEEWAGLQARPIDAEELDRAKVQLRTGMVFSLETAEGRMHWLARWALADREPWSLEQFLAEVTAVTIDDVARARSTLDLQDDSILACAAAGPRRALPRDLRERFLSGIGDAPTRRR